MVNLLLSPESAPSAVLGFIGESGAISSSSHLESGCTALDG